VDVHRGCTYVLGIGESERLHSLTAWATDDRYLTVHRPDPFGGVTANWQDPPVVFRASPRMYDVVRFLAAIRYGQWDLFAPHSRNNMCAAIMLDRDLIRDCRNVDVGAWQRLLDRYERLVFSVPRRYGLSREATAHISNSRSPF
jgi:hypothetical protein